MEFIDVKTQYRRYKEEIDQAIHAVLDHGAYILGPEIRELEEKLARYVGVKHAITVANGTDALMMALMAYDIGPGDEVITVPFTWISSAEVIPLIKAQPVFVDIEPDTFNIDVNKVQEAITPRTKAIIPVNLFGQMADYTALKAIAAKHHIPIIEDAAQSFGATQNGKQSCSVTEIGSTSFYPAKPLGCYGDGGALFTNDDHLGSKLRALRTHGGEVRHHHIYIGLNGRFDTIQAAVVLVKLKYFNEEIRLRDQVAKRYDERLRDYCIIPQVSEGNTSTHAMYTIRVPNRDEVVAHLSKAGIPTGLYYPKCVHEQPCFSYLGYKQGSFPVSEAASKEVLSLPMHPWLTEEEQDHICAKIAECVVAPVA